MSATQRPCIDPDFLTEKLPGRRVPRKENEHVRAHCFARRRRSIPRTELCAGHLRRFEHALRADDDLHQVELHVRERAEERRVELARPLVAIPALAGGNDFISAVRGQGGDGFGSEGGSFISKQMICAPRCYGRSSAFFKGFLCSRRR